MPTRFTCPRCGESNASDQAPCWKCHYLQSATTNLQSLITPTASPAEESLEPPPSLEQPSHAPSPTDYYRVPGEMQHNKQINRTTTGLLLLAIGLILGAIPYISIIGGLLELIGAILVILGRDVFGPEHARNTIISLALYIVGFLVVVISTFGFASSLSIGLSTAQTTTDKASVVTSAFNGYLVAVIAAAIIFGLGTVLFTYSLQQETGRLLLWLGYAVSITVSTVTLIIISPLVGNAVAVALSGGTYNPAPIQSLQSQVQLLGLFGIIPAAFYAVAYNMARSRIERGELPEPITPYAVAPASYFSTP